MNDLPRPSAHHPPTAVLRRLRPPVGALLRRRFDLHVHGTEHAPATGPVIFASNHAGWLDGPLLAVFAPRPVHALTKEEMFEGRTGRFLRAAGQIPLNRFGADPSAIKSCLRVLADGGAVGIFPEGTRGGGDLQHFHHGAAYLALVSGAPVVPATQIGTRMEGGGISSVPPRGSRIDIVFGEPLTTEPRRWPRTREHILGTSALLWDHMREQQHHALALTGGTLPGPLPAGDIEDDPHTGFVEQGTS